VGGGNGRTRSVARKKYFLGVYTMPLRMRRRGRISKRKPMFRRKRQYGGRRIAQPVQLFKRTAYSTAFTVLAGGAAAAGGARAFSLSQVPNSAEFSTLYDQYQIKGIKVQMIPRYTEALPGASTIGNMWSVIDYDDQVVPPGIDTLMQYQNVKRTRLNQVHTRYFKPKVATEVFNTGIATAYAPKANVWLDCTSTTVEHYGIKFWFDSSTAGVTFDLQVTYYLAFKNVR